MFDQFTKYNIYVHYVIDGDCKSDMDTSAMDSVLTVEQIVKLSFPRDGCRRAEYCSGNACLEKAVTWVRESIEEGIFLVKFNTGDEELTR